MCGLLVHGPNGVIAAGEDSEADRGDTEATTQPL